MEEQSKEQTNAQRWLRQPLAWIAVFVLIVAAVGLVWHFAQEEDAANGNGEQVEETEIEDNTAYLGLTEEEAGDLAEEEGLEHRVINRDGEALVVTMDFRPNRLNFWVEDGVVIEVATDEQLTPVEDQE